MKFSIRTPHRRAPRLGVLENIENRPDVVLATPLALLHTQGGHIPHVTHEVFKLVSREPQILQIPLVSMHCFQQTLHYFDGTISEFIGSKDSLTCLTLHDPSNLTKQGHHLKDKVPIWTKHGKVFYNADMYMDVVESFNPDMYYLLSDGDTNMSSSQKRVAKAVENTIAFSRQCLERHRKSTVLKSSFVMAPIAGGYCVDSREKCIKAILKENSDLDGFLIDGLHNNGPEVEFLPFDEIKSIVSFTIQNLPANKLCSVQGCWSPLNVLKLVQEGVDMFDTSYCRILTERAAALTFAVDDTNEDSDTYEINLRQSKYAEDFTPISSSCKCLACTKYSRGYIHHLLTVQELLAPVLIMIHNVHHYLRFFTRIRECIASDTLSDLENSIYEQYKAHQERAVGGKSDEDDGDVSRVFRNYAGDVGF